MWRNRDARLEAAREAPTTGPVLTHLAADSDEAVRCAVAARADTPPATLNHLSRDSGYNVRMRVAQNASTPPEALKHLAAAGEMDYWLATNPSSPTAVLTALAAPPQRLTWQIAANPSCPQDLLNKLCAPGRPRTDDENGRLLANPNCPPDTVAAIAVEVAARSQANLLTIESPDLAHAVPRHPATPQQVLRAWVAKRSPGWQGAAGNPTTPHDVRVVLASVPDPSVRAAVADCAATLPSLLNDLADDADPLVVAAVGANMAAWPETLRNLAESPNVAVRAAVASNTATDGATVDALRGDPSVRVTAAAHRRCAPSTPSPHDPATVPTLSAAAGLDL